MFKMFNENKLEKKLIKEIKKNLHNCFLELNQQANKMSIDLENRISTVLEELNITHQVSLLNSATFQVY